MNKRTKKDLLLLMTAGAAFIASNLMIFMGVQSGQIAPVDNMLLWGGFAVLSVCSLIWAVSLLGLQPLVVAVSYSAGGFIAYQGVRLTPGVNVAEIATAGATYGAFGALVVGNATTKVRLAFFTKKQVPFIAIILALLLMDGLLNSRVSNAGLHVITNAVVIPFLLCGVIVGLAWLLISKVKPVRRKNMNISESLEQAEQPASLPVEKEETAGLMFSVPDGADAAVTAEHEASSPDINPKESSAPAEAAVLSTPSAGAVDPDQDFSDSFFPLEIDEGEDQRIEENPELLGLAAMVAQSAPESAVENAPEPAVYSAPEPIIEAAPELTEYITPDPILDDAVVERTEDGSPEPKEEELVSYVSERSSVPDDTAAEESTHLETPAKGEESNVEEGKSGSENWLNSHLDLLNKLK